MADREKIGIVGVGRMGQAMTKHLIRHGYAVLVQDIEPKALEAARAEGAEPVKMPADVGRACKFVIIAVGYDDEAAAVMLDQGGLLETMGAGTVIAVSSTCMPEHVKMLAEKAQAKGVDILDAPICRGQRAADDGTMLTLCGGKPEVFERSKPIYGAFSKDIVLLGDIGAGQVGKAMNNFLLWVNGIALIEAGRLSEANGMDLAKLREALLISSGASDALKNWENVSFLWAL
jgi:3-hydroxyisobutyrate dehydrogenase-like beta-hydroxyacid dehydrogenase